MDGNCPWSRTCRGCEKLDDILESQKRACATCVCYGPDADEVPVCHKYWMTMLPCDWCGEWKGEQIYGKQQG